jgi:hypothetical protein
VRSLSRATFGAFEKKNKMEIKVGEEKVGKEK